MSEKLESLKAYLNKQYAYRHATSLMYWDMTTIMPKDGFENKSDAMTVLSTESFKLATSPELKQLLTELTTGEEYEALDEDWKFIVNKMKKKQEISEKIPVELFEAFSRAKNESSFAWKEAKQKSDFSIFAPHLQKMIDFSKQIAQCTYPEKDIYDTLVDEYEEGMDAQTIDKIFGELKEELVPFLKQILSKPEPDMSKFERTYDLKAQEEVQKYLLSYIGFNWDRGTVGETEHPFTLNLSSKDVRVSNHFRKDSAIDPMFSAIHEGGHAIFEQNINPKYEGTVAGSCHYMGIHESQSRFFENILGRNINFWKPIYSDIQKLQPEFREVTLEEFYREINHIKSSLIRTQADEVTYCLHVIIRFEIERAIFRDGIRVEELPALWNSKMKEYLQIVPEKDADGILQDMHWSDGSFGYFPSYLLGSIYDGMFLETMEEELGKVDDILAEGRVKEITKWLNEKIHVYGSRRLPREVLTAVCGDKEISAKPLMKYFREKYSAIYNL